MVNVTNVIKMQFQLIEELILLTLNGMKVVATKVTPDMISVQHLSTDASTMVTLTYTIADGWNVTNLEKVANTIG